MCKKIKSERRREESEREGKIERKLKKECVRVRGNDVINQAFT